MIKWKPQSAPAATTRLTMETEVAVTPAATGVAVALWRRNAHCCKRITNASHKEAATDSASTAATIETRSLSALARCYPRSFTFYVADPSASFFADRDRH